MLRKIKGFTYLKPFTVSEAISLLDEYNGKAKILAGGTDLLIQMKQRTQNPEYVIDIKNIPELGNITYDENEGLSIGPLATYTALASSPVVREKFGLLADAAFAVGSPQIQNRGTVAGNLCNASPSADTAPALIALNAQLRLVSMKGERIVSVEEFFVGPFKTILKDTEILAEILIPNVPLHSGGSYLWLPKIITAVDETLVGVGALITVDDMKNKICTEARIGLGSVAPTPIRAKKAGESLKGKRIENGLFEQAGVIASTEALPRSRAEYRSEMIKVFVKRALNRALERIR